jgi:hypothetical protein
MYIPVADAHGIVEDKILSVIYPLFDIFVIHSYIGEKGMVDIEVEKIKNILKDPLIFIIFHDETLRDS